VAALAYRGDDGPQVEGLGLGALLESREHLADRLHPLVLLLLALRPHARHVGHPRILVDYSHTHTDVNTETS
jgi:hypothetical protein